MKAIQSKIGMTTKAVANCYKKAQCLLLKKVLYIKLIKNKYTKNAILNFVNHDALKLNGLKTKQIEVSTLMSN